MTNSKHKKNPRNPNKFQIQLKKNHKHWQQKINLLIQTVLRQTEAPVGVPSRNEPQTSIFGKTSVKVSIFIGSIAIFFVVGLVGFLAIFGLVSSSRKAQNGDFVEMSSELTQEELDSLIKRNSKATHVPSYKVPTNVEVE
jgi:hypothetical protein